MKISKTKLWLGSVIFITIIITSIFTLSYIQNENRKIQHINELEATRQKMLDKIYDELYSDYIRYIEQALDDDYSFKTRRKAVFKLNSLLGEEYFKITDYSFDRVEIYNARNNKEALGLLRNQAKLKLIKEMYKL